MKAGASTQGSVEPGTPFSSAQTMQSCITARLELSATTDLAGRRTQHRGEQGAGFGEALQNAVVAGVFAGLGEVVAVAGESQHGRPPDRVVPAPACRASCRV